jgi:YggT family protein
MAIVCLALTLYSLILFVRIILSWVTMAWSPPPSLAPVIGVIYDLTEPVLGYVRRFLPTAGGIDFSPLVIFLVISVVQQSIC